jgi:hypothetical protein
MKRCVLLLLAGLMVGCRDDRKPDPSAPPPPWGHYQGPEELRWSVRAAMEALLNKTGFPEHEARKWSIEVRRCDPTGRDARGFWFTCATGCTAGHDCVCAWATSDRRDRRARFMFAYPQGHLPDQRVIVHEALHPILVFYLGQYGHPESVVLNGTSYVCKDLLGLSPVWGIGVMGLADYWLGFPDPDSCPRYEDVQ